MKKLIAILLVALLAIVLVACGGNDTTTPATTTDGGTVTTTEGGNDTTTEETTTEPEEDEDEPRFAEGIDIMNGDYEYMAVNPFWSQGMYPCAFEDQHIQLDFNWSLVFTMTETSEGVYEQLISTDTTLPEGTPNDQTWIVNDQYKWIVVIDGEEFEITRFSILNDVVSGYIRMDLGPDYQPHDELHEYEIDLKIYDKDTGELAFWAWFSDPNLCGKYEFEKPAPIVMAPAEKPEGVEALPTGALVGVSGAAGFNASETYVNLFDGMVRTKLCTNDVTTSIIFGISEDMVANGFNIKGFSIVGANDDEQYSSRIITNFKLSGATSGDDGAAWVTLVDQDWGDEPFTPVNYGEQYYAFSQDSSYRYYKLEITHATDMYQISELLLYAETGSVSVN